ncbi:MAG: GntR family transcriptional regulator [Desulfatitalea sp.]|nr:GntR family transcriptional regulator [Desulfatitalea sp.]
MAIGQNIPLFFRLYYKLKQDIIRGEIPSGARIETISELSQRYGVSQSSVRKSLDLLEREGLLVRKQGWGTQVPKDLKLYFFNLARVIQSRKTFDEMNKADIAINDVCWVTPNETIRRILMCNGDNPEAQKVQKVFKIDSKSAFPGKFNFKALVTYYFPQTWLDHLGIDDSVSPRNVLLHMSQWVISRPMKMKEAILPFICTDETAECLGLPDGTPVFHNTVGVVDPEACVSCCWEMISTANSFYREMDLNFD